MSSTVVNEQQGINDALVLLMTSLEDKVYPPLENIEARSCIILLFVWKKRRRHREVLLLIRLFDDGERTLRSGCRCANHERDTRLVFHVIAPAK